MFFGVMFGRLLCVVFSMDVMPMSDVRVMAGRLMFAFLIIPSRLLVMFRGVLVMFRCFFVMFYALVCAWAPPTVQETVAGHQTPASAPRG